MLFLLLTFGLDLLDKGGPRPAWLQAGRTEPLLEMTSKAMVEFVDKTRAGQPIGKSLGEAVMPAEKPAASPHQPAPASETKPQGYRNDDRNALDKLLNGSGDTPAPAPAQPAPAGTTEI